MQVFNQLMERKFFKPKIDTFGMTKKNLFLVLKERSRNHCQLLMYMLRIFNPKKMLFIPNKHKRQVQEHIMSEMVSIENFHNFISFRKLFFALLKFNSKITFSCISKKPHIKSFSSLLILWLNRLHDNPL